MEEEVNHERLWTLKNNLRVFKGWGFGDWGNQVVGIGEGMDCMEHWVWCKNNEYVKMKILKKLKNNEYCYTENKISFKREMD